jgi:hypothetical protein
MVGPIKPRITYDGFMNLSEVCRLFEVSPSTVRRRLRAQNKGLFPYPSDKRLRMIHEDDIRSIFRIVPAAQRMRDKGASKG